MSKILLIEDDTQVSELYLRELETAGYEVVQAFTGGEGINRAVEVKPDLIIVDIMMPVVDGFTIIKKLRDNLQTKDIPVLILTNLNENEVFLAEAKKLGVEYYLVKTGVNKEKLISTIEEALS